MSKINDGGPAFPVPPNEQEQLQDGWERYPRGMSLRDYFAIHAPASEIDGMVGDTAAACAKPLVMSTYEYVKSRGAAYAKLTAMLRYQWADSMIEERDKKISR